MMYENDESHNGCCCRGLKGFIRPRILFRIAQKPMYGYELMESFAEMDHPAPPDTGGLYRMLRSMEKDSLLASDWDTDESGPARRIYRLTEKGRQHLENWVRTLAETRKWLDAFLDSCREVLEIENEKPAG